MRWKWPFKASSGQEREPSDREVRVVVEEAPPEPPEDDDLLRTVSDAAWRLLIIGVVVALILWGATYIWVVVLPVILAVFVTALLAPPTAWLRGRGLGRGPSTAITVLGGLVLFSGVITLIVMPAVAGFDAIVTNVNQAISGLQNLAATYGVGDQLLNDWVNQAQDAIQRNSSQLLSGAWSGALAVGEILLGLVLTLVLTVYFVHSGDQLMRWVSELFPKSTRNALRVAGDVSYGVIGRYVRGVALVGAIDAIGIGLILVVVLDLSLAMPLILLTFIGAFLPVIGAFLSGLISVLVGLVTEGWIVALIILGGTVAVQQLESNVFAPRVYGRSLELPSAIVLLAISVGSIVGGLAGAFLATPVAAVLAALLRNRPYAAPDGQASGGRGRGPEPRDGASASVPAAPSGGTGGDEAAERHDGGE